MIMMLICFGLIVITRSISLIVNPVFKEDHAQEPQAIQRKLKANMAIHQLST